LKGLFRKISGSIGTVSNLGSSGGHFFGLCSKVVYFIRLIS
jgi:hypothetical protein